MKKILTNLPFLPYEGKMTFNYKGIVPQDFRNKEDYERSCTEKKIIPYSKIIMKTRMGYKMIDFQDEHIKDFFEGNKINTCLFNIQRSQYEESISQIINNAVPKLFEQNYEFYSGELKFFMGQERMPERGLNYFPMATLNIQSKVEDEDDYLSIHLENSLSGEENKQKVFVNWIKDLSPKTFTIKTERGYVFFEKRKTNISFN
jgi:hypothetical protein